MGRHVGGQRSMWWTCAEACAGTCAQVLFKVFSGQKPDIPADMPAEYRALMEACWATDPAARPTFPEILLQLRSMLEVAAAPQPPRSLID